MPRSLIESRFFLASIYHPSDGDEKMVQFSMEQSSSGKKLVIESFG